MQHAAAADAAADADAELLVDTDNTLTMKGTLRMQVHTVSLEALSCYAFFGPDVLLMHCGIAAACILYRWIESCCSQHE